MSGRNESALSARTVRELVAAHHAGETPPYLFFWGHTSRSDELGPHCLSQWYPATFRDAAGTTFASAEHYMMWRKALLFDDSATAAAVIAAATPEEAKALGRRVSGFDTDTWAAHRFEAVVDGSMLKFGGDQALRGYLLGTAGQVLVEASPVDAIWGIGLAADSEHAGDPTAWPGLNLLGFALMEARERLRAGLL